MPRLPSSSDVPTVSPRIARDPGVSVPSTRVPQGAFDSSAGVMAEELAPAFGKLAEIAAQQERSNALVTSIDIEEQYFRELDENFRLASTQEDLSKEETLSKFGQFSSSRKQELLRNFAGPEDVRISLYDRLQKTESEFIGKAATESTKLRRDKVLRAHDRRLAPLIQRVSQDPSPESIDRAMLELEDNIKGFSGSLGISDEELLRADREEIALASLDSLIIRSRPEQAEALLDSRLLNELSPENQRAVRSRIEKVYESREQARLESLQNTVRIIPQSEIRQRFPSLPAGSIVEETVDQIAGVSKGITIKHTPSQDINKDAVNIASLASELQTQYGFDPQVALDAARSFVLEQSAFHFNPATGQATFINAAGLIAGDPNAVREVPIVRPAPPPLRTPPRGQDRKTTTTTPQQTVVPFAPAATGGLPIEMTNEATQPVTANIESAPVMDEQEALTALDNLVQGGGIDVSQAAGLIGFLRNAANIVSDSVGAGLPFERASEAANELNALQIATFGALREQIPGRENIKVDEMLRTITIQPNSPLTGKNSVLNKLKKQKEIVDQELQRIELDVLPMTLKHEEEQKVLINRTILHQQSINLGQVIDAFGRGDAVLSKPINQMTLPELQSLDLDMLSDEQVRQAQQQMAIVSGQAVEIPEGQTATNPQTGERIIMRNGKWERLLQ